MIKNVRITDFYTTLSHNIWPSMPEDYSCHVSGEVTRLRNITGYSALVDYYGENNTIGYSDSSIEKKGIFLALLLQKLK